MKITFEKFNENINYYSKATRTTGVNAWRQDELQSQFTSLISECELTKEQLSSLDSFMIGTDATIGLNETKNNSVIEFSEFINSKEETIQKAKAA